MQVDEFIIRAVGVISKAIFNSNSLIQIQTRHLTRSTNNQVAMNIQDKSITIMNNVTSAHSHQATIERKTFESVKLKLIVMLMIRENGSKLTN